MYKKPLSLYRVYARAFGARIALGGLVKILGDLSTFIPPLALAGAIKYVTGIYYGDSTPDETNVSSINHSLSVDIVSILKDHLILY